MDVFLIKDGKVDNCICADSVERAQQFFPDHICIERTEQYRGFGPGDLYDGVEFIKAPYVHIISPISRLEFLRRFTSEQRIAIRASTDPVIIDGRELLDLAQEVLVNDPDTVLYVRYLEQQGFISSEDADRILEVNQ
jgi:hypothetical protein